jgi:hypothetical protein
MARVHTREGGWLPTEACDRWIAGNSRSIVLQTHENMAWTPTYRHWSDLGCWYVLYGQGVQADVGGKRVLRMKARPQSLDTSHPLSKLGLPDQCQIRITGDSTHFVAVGCCR